MKNFLIRIMLSATLALFTYALLLLIHTPDRIPLIVAGIVGGVALLFYGWDNELRSDAFGLGIQFVIPLLIGAGIWYFWGSYQIHSTWGKVIPFLGGIGAWYIISVVVMSGRGPQPVYIRGSYLIDYKAALEHAEKLLVPGEPSLYWGGLSLPLKAAENHFLVTGTIGSGKTITIDLLMSSVLPHINQEEKWRALVYDAKGDAVSKLKYLHKGSDIVILNPFDNRCAAWDIAKDITSGRDIQELASILFPAAKAAREPFWDNAAQALLKGVVLTFASLPKSKTTWTLRDIILAMRTRGRLKAVLLQLSEQNAARIENFLSAGKTTANLMTDIQSRLDKYEAIAAQWYRAAQEQRVMSLEKWSKGDSILVLGRSARAAEALTAVNSIMFTRMAQILLDEKELPPGKTWLFLDEFSKAGKLPLLDELATMGRTKGVVLVLGFQDIAGIQEVYGPNLTQELTNVVGNKAVLRLAAGNTARWAQDQFGDQEINDPSMSHGTSSGPQGTSSTETVNWNKKTRPIIMASEFTKFATVEGANPPGVVGAYNTPTIGSYSVNLTLKTVHGFLGNIQQREKSEDFHKADPSYDELQNWSPEDMRRLGFPESILHAKSDNIDSNDLDYEE